MRLFSFHLHLTYIVNLVSIKKDVLNINQSLKILIYVSVLFSSLFATKIKGTVIDKETGTPLIGANVFLLEVKLDKPTDMGGKQGFSSQPSTANPVESMQVADELRKIQTDQNISPEERKSKAKDFLKQKMSERGISAIGESEPLRKR